MGLHGPQEAFHRDSGVFQGFKGDTRSSQGCLKGVLGGFRGTMGSQGRPLELLWNPLIPFETSLRPPGTPRDCLKRLETP